MDELHTIRENFDKVQALIDAIESLYGERNTFSHPALIFQLETLKTLSDEATASLDTLKDACAKLH